MAVTLEKYKKLNEVNERLHGTPVYQSWNFGEDTLLY